jgi:hypothetical protein
LHRSIRILLTAATVALVVAMMSPIAYADAGLKLRPGSFGANTEGAWKSKQGLPDSKGNARHALYLQKFTQTSDFVAAYAVVDNIEGLPANQLTKLSWEHRDDGHCGAGAPRWNIVVKGQSGTEYTLFLGCAAAVHTFPHPDWTKDSYTGAAILTVGAANSGNTLNLADIQAGTITALYVLFDEGTDQGPGFVYLDNITVNDKVFTGPMDNGHH